MKLNYSDKELSEFFLTTFLVSVKARFVEQDSFGHPERSSHQISSFQTSEKFNPSMDVQSLLQRPVLSRPERNSGRIGSVRVGGELARARVHI